MGCKITMLPVAIKGKHKHFSKELKDLKKKQIFIFQVWKRREYKFYAKNAITEIDDSVAKYNRKWDLAEENVSNWEIDEKNYQEWGTERQRNKNYRREDETARIQLEDLICLIVKTKENATYMNRYKVTLTE